MAPDGRKEGRTDGHGQTYTPPPSAGDDNAISHEHISKLGRMLRKIKKEQNNILMKFQRG